MTDKQLSTADAAKYLGYSEYMLRQSRSTGVLYDILTPKCDYVGKSAKYDIDVLSSWKSELARSRKDNNLRSDLDRAEKAVAVLKAAIATQDKWEATPKEIELAKADHSKEISSIRGKALSDCAIRNKKEKEAIAKRGDARIKHKEKMNARKAKRRAKNKGIKVEKKDW